MSKPTDILQTIARYRDLVIEEQIDHKKFYLYSIITHSTAIEGSTVTEIENQLLFDEGITAPGRTLQEQKAEYIQALNDTRDKEDETIFPNVMLRLHNGNLLEEIKEYTKSQKEDTTLQPYNLTTLMKEILVYCNDWHSVGEIAEHFMRSRQYIRGEVLPKMSDLLERKYDTPNHPHQQYRTKQS